MDVFIQHVVTKLYLKSPEVWVKEASEALCFSGSLPAIDFCLENKMREVFIVLRFDQDPRFDIRLRPFLLGDGMPSH